MYFGTYTFKGDPYELLQAYDRLRATGLGDLHVAHLREAVV